MLKLLLKPLTQAVKLYFRGIFALLLLSITPVQAGMIDKEGMAAYEICALCHSLNGVSPMAKFPKLAGQPKLYIKKQIKDFLSGARTNDGGQMSAIVTEIELEDIDAIADWFSSQVVDIPEPDSSAIITNGETLFKQHKCDNCHRGVGQQAPHIPYLKAQHRAYLAKQMLDFKDGSRSNDLGKLMQNAMLKVGDDEIDKIAAYLASQKRYSKVRLNNEN